MSENNFKEVPEDAICFLNETHYMAYLLRKAVDDAKPKYKLVDADLICVLPNGEIFQDIITELP
jgi:hypothetical protein